MTIAALGVTAVYYGLGSAGPFPLADDDSNPILFQNDNEIVVKIFSDPSGEYTAGSLLVLNVDYTLTGAGSPTPGAILLTAPLPLAYLLVARRTTAPTQTLDLLYGSDLSLEDLEAELDKLTRLIQEQKEQTSRSLMFSATETTLDGSLSRMVPAPVSGKVLGWVGGKLTNVDGGPAGPTGSPGPKGPAGKTPGPPGDEGEQGPQGPPGRRGPAGTGATGPRGKIGAPGLLGDDGDQGERGPPGRRGGTGTAGSAGPRGQRGAPGTDGDDGDIGLPGRRGLAGAPGSAGPAGPKGKTLFGAEGEQGDQGDAGPPGKRGPVGPPGIPGPSGARRAFIIEGSDGDDGQLGVAGKRGPTGLPGIQGPAGGRRAFIIEGADGEDGIAGPRGLRGVNGAPGIQGPAGSRRTILIPGGDADDGDRGSPGRRGATGPAGSAPTEILVCQNADNAFGVNSAVAQAVFTTAADTLTVSASTTYMFEALYWITRIAGTTSHTTSLLFGGSATFTNVDYSILVVNTTGTPLFSTNAQFFITNVATATVITAANIVATENILVRLRGSIRVNAGGNIIPQFQYSVAPGGVPTVKRGSFFRAWSVGADTFLSSGGWA